MSLTKATIKNLDSGETIKCLFNPTEYTVAKSNPWNSKPVIGRNVPELEFTGGGPKTLTMELFFDVYEETGKPDVRDHINKLWNLTRISEKTVNSKTDRGRPPLCLFQWGPNWSFTAVVMSLSVRFTLFHQDGTPVRAVANVTMQQAEDDEKQKGTNPTSHAEPGRKRREVRLHDTLALIAYDEYGDPSLWRAIAKDNQIEDPMDLRPGSILSIPPRS
jgi:hypothetical protein